MRSKIVHDESSEKIFVLVLDVASLTAIGAFSGATFGYFKLEQKIPVEE